MIRNEAQRKTTESKEKAFSRLIERMENGDDQAAENEDPRIRRDELEAARSVRDELRDELRQWDGETAEHNQQEPAR